MCQLGQRLAVCGIITKKITNKFIRNKSSPGHLGLPNLCHKQITYKIGSFQFLKTLNDVESKSAKLCLKELIFTIRNNFPASVGEQARTANLRNKTF